MTRYGVIKTFDISKKGWLRWSKCGLTRFVILQVKGLVGAIEP